jgi:hypothetical protein
MRDPPMPNYPPPARPDTTTTTTSSSPTRSSPTTTTQPDATISNARTNSPPTTGQLLRPTAPAIPQLTDSTGQFSQVYGSSPNTNIATLPTHERLQLEQLHRQQRLEGCLRFRDMIAQQGLFERNIEEWCLDNSDSGGINPWRARLDHVVPAVPVALRTHVPSLSDFVTDPNVGSTEVGEIFWQVASGNDPDKINIAWAPDPNLLPRPWRPDQQRKYKTRRVFQGDSVLAEDDDAALLRELSTDSATLTASYVNNPYGYRTRPGPDYIPLTSASFRTHSIRDFPQRVKLRRRLWKGSWPLWTGPSRDE